MTKRNRRAVSLLDDVLERRVVLYVMAAGAILAGASATQAKVVYTSNFTELQGRNDVLNIDLNNDGVKDFTLSIHTYDSVNYVARLAARGARGGNSAAVYFMGGLARALSKGAPIGSSASFFNRATLASDSTYGYFVNTFNRYLGVRFVFNHEYHYAWIGFQRVRTGFYNHIQAKVVGWAYETVPNKTILAGDMGLDDSAILGTIEPTSLGLLAMGHTGIADRQRRIAAQATS